MTRHASIVAEITRRIADDICASLETDEARVMVAYRIIRQVKKTSETRAGRAQPDAENAVRTLMVAYDHID